MAYRDDLEALEQREANLAEELERIDEAMRRAQALADRRVDKSRELARVRSRLRARGAGSDTTRPASPCSAAWELMDGEGRARRCQACGKRVFNLSGLPRAEAKLLLAEHGVGARLRRREDGTFIDGDCPLGRRLRHRTRTVVAGGTVALIGAGIIASAAVRSIGPEPRVDPNAVDGAAAFTPIELDNEIDVELLPPRKPRAPSGKRE